MHSFKYLYFYIIIFAIQCSCNSINSDTDVITTNDTYTVYPDKVVQGTFEAIAMTPLWIRTNYSSPSDKEFSPIVEFRFSINSRDNELTPGLSHYAIVGDNDTTIYRLGIPQKKPYAKLPPLNKNTSWTIVVDLNPMLNAFKEKGYYVTPTQDTIYAEDFKGVWVAGGAQPLTWDFENLYCKDEFKLSPTKKRGIYSTTITFNTNDNKAENANDWKITSVNAKYPTFSSGALMIDALYNMSIDNIVSNIRTDTTFRAGAAWDGVWTRDVSYSIYLALSYLNPEIAMKSLKAKVKNDRIVQDTGTGGAWPVSSDRIVWTTAAWEIYKVTGDVDWLKYSYQVIKNTLIDDGYVVYDKVHNLMHGEQSYLDWREQSYPKWMQPADIYSSMTLGTNVLFANAYEIMDEMCDELNIEDNSYEQKHDRLKKTINSTFWLTNKGYYSEYLYGSPYPILSESVDNLAQSLAIIMDISSDAKSSSIIEKTPVTIYGTTSTYPMIKDIKPYHNNAIWPFVQSFWNLAAAKVGNVTAVYNGLGALYRAAALFGTHKELYVASTGDFRGTAVNSDKMLWSAAGNAAMIFRLYAGMEFKPNGIEFSPFIPTFISDDIRISNFKYRKSILNITIRGSGNTIDSMYIDNQQSPDNFYPATMKGRHNILIVMKDFNNVTTDINLSPVVEMPSTPQIKWNQNVGNINNYLTGLTYKVYLNGEMSHKVKSKYFVIRPKVEKYTTVMVNSYDSIYTSFATKPHELIPHGSLIVKELRNYAPAGTSFIKDAKAKKFVESTTSKNTDIRIPVHAVQEGTYFIDVRYANGNGPINTENKCAIRSLIVNGTFEGALVMPQRGIGEWLNTGFSNMIQVKLKAGKNLLQIKYLEPYNVNMNGIVNTALIEYIRIIKM